MSQLCSSPISTSFSPSTPRPIMETRRVVRFCLQSQHTKNRPPVDNFSVTSERLCCGKIGSRVRPPTGANRIAAATLTWFPGWACVICDDTTQYGHNPSLELSRTEGAHPQPHSPLEGVPVPEDLTDLLPTAILVLWVQSHAVQKPGDGTRGRVMAFKHERIHLSPDLCI